MPRVRSRDPLSLLDTSASIDYCRPEHNTPEATAYQLSTVDQGRRKTLTEQISHSQIAGCAPLGPWAWSLSRGQAREHCDGEQRAP
jgi:hypothetical protein